MPRVIDLLDASVDRIHFDEAWYGYARFNPIYKDRFGLYGDPKDYPKDKPTIFTTTSTHKLLAALSQASLISVRDGRKPVEHARFNEAFMMHASTSPQYAIIASNEVALAMMDGVGGRTLTTESIAEAVAFRKAVCRAHRRAQAQGDWLFRTWNADEVTDPATGKKFAFADAPDELLISNPDCWVLHPGEAWHGFQGLEDGYCMLDPIKVSVVTPGVANDGSFEKLGIPATLVTACLDQRGMLAGIFPLAGQFGTAFWVAVLTAGLSSFMASFMASNPGASEAAAQASALGTLAWIGAAITLVTLAASLLLQQVAGRSPAPAGAKQPGK